MMMGTVNIFIIGFMQSRGTYGQISALSRFHWSFYSTLKLGVPGNSFVTIGSFEESFIPKTNIGVCLVLYDLRHIDIDFCQIGVLQEFKVSIIESGRKTKIS